MSHDGLEDDHGWVVRMLASDNPGPMPAALTDRITAMLTTASSVTASPVTASPVTTSPVTASPDATSPDAVPHAEVPQTAVPHVEVPPVAVFPVGGPARQARDALSTGEPDRDRVVGRGKRRDGARRVQRQEAASDRRHFFVYRLLPVAASMVVLAGASVVGAGQLRNDPDEQQSAATLSEVDATGPVPNGLVATGTQYTEAGLAEQAAGLLGVVAAPRPAAEAAQADEATADAGEAQPDASVGGDPAAASRVLSDPILASPLTAAAAYEQCATTLGAPAGVLPAAIDLAVYDGAEAAIVVLPNRAGDGYEVIVTDRYCTPDTQRGSATFRTS